MPPAFRVVILSPPGYRHAAAFHEIAETLTHAIRASGHPVTLGYNRFSADAIHLVLGSNLASPALARAIPAGSVIYNLEQIDAGSKWWHEGLRTLVERCETWDYSERNVRTFAALGVTRPVTHVPLGYAPALTRIERAPVQDIDVLFYGSVNPRRQQLLDSLRARGLNVVQLFGVYGTERDAHIARAKIVLNSHLYPAQIFEVARVSYLLANRKAVVSECEPGTALEPGIESAVRLVSYDAIADACVALAADAPARAELEAAGHAWISARPMAAILAPHLARLSAAHRASPVVAAPTRLRLGGFDLPVDGWLCADADNAAADFSLGADRPLPLGETVRTVRYGEVDLAPGSLDAIDAGDWPARTEDLNAFLRDCARLLRFGGTLTVRVPHDLSAERDADPCLRRAFNEKSFGRYGDAHVRLGWGDCALELTDLQLELSEYGIGLKNAGNPADMLSRTPRAVDRIAATLTRRGYRAPPGA